MLSYSLLYRPESPGCRARLHRPRKTKLPYSLVWQHPSFRAFHLARDHRK